MEEKEKFKLYQKWWFWLIALAIAIIIGITIIMVTALFITTTGIHEVAKKVQSIDNEAIVYTSAGGNTIIIEIPNYSDDTKKDKQDAIEKLLKGYASKNGILNNYSKAIICERINKNEDVKDYFLTTKVYSLPTMTEDKDEGNVYIDFVEYTKNTLDSTSSKTNNASTKGEDITLTTGKYTVGTDIKPGKYDVIVKSGSGNFFVHGSTSVNEILSIDASKNASYGYIDNYKNLTLKNGDTVELRSNLNILLQAK